MPKDISDIRKAFGVPDKQSKEETEEDEEEQASAKPETAEKPERKEAPAKTPAPTILIPTTDPYYNFIMNSPTVTPAVIKRYDVKGKQILVLVDSLDRPLLNCTITLPAEE